MPIYILIHSRRGQTLVEALVALSILTMGLAGIVVLLNQSLQLNRTTTNDTQATYLASEGIEIVKNMIDHDVYKGLPVNDDWDASFSQSGYYWNIDYETTSTTGLPVRANQMQATPLYYNSTTNMFGYSAVGAAPTNFVRNIKITNIDNSNLVPVEIDVQSIVTWTNGGNSNAITLEDHFYDWHPLSP
ncbi:MAG TPA: prepilin-type N-terminal cleavage/methylation domain-containing protein [Candidatus Paceibacterota bacterium]